MGPGFWFLKPLSHRSGHGYKYYEGGNRVEKTKNAKKSSAGPVKVT